jgi:ankyrin repeat protein
MAEETGDLLDQTLYLASRIYDSGDSPIPLDLHSACAIGNYKCVQERIDEGVDLNARNKGMQESACWVIKTL